MGDEPHGVLQSAREYSGDEAARRRVVMSMDAIPQGAGWLAQYWREAALAAALLGLFAGAMARQSFNA